MSASRAVSTRDASARLNRIAGAILVLPLLAWLHACGSSATTVTSPTTISRCAITVQPFEGQIPAQGGSGSLNVGAARDCTWTASTDGQWLSIRAGSNGQGDGTVQFSASANPDPATRKGAIVLNSQRAEITQAAAPCEFSLAESSAAFGQSGGSGTVQLRASSGMCAWTATSNASWITLRASNGTGASPVPFEVAATTGPPRTGTLTIAGQTFSVTQSEGCGYTVAPTAQSVSSAGGTVVVTIASGAGCDWTATTDVPWITIQGANSGTGNASVTLAVAATSGPTRTGTATIAGQRVTITQSPGCAFSISPETASVAASGGTGRISVSVNAGCGWTAVSNDQWLTIVSGAAGSGNGEVQYSVTPTTGPGRTATMTVAGKTFTLNQGQGCTFALSSTSLAIADSGGQGSFNVQAAAGCGWTVASSVPWMTITSATSGSGDGQVRFDVAANAGPPRSGAITAAGQTFSVQQGNGCAFSLSSSGQNVPAAGATGTVNVATSSGCTWNAASNASWLSITSGSSGSGNGTVGFTAAALSGPARSGTLTIADKTFTVSQSDGCTFNIASDQTTVASGGGTATVAVTSQGGCAWTSTSNAPWIRVTSGATGNGNGSVQLAIDPNTAAGRVGTVTIAGRTFTITQGGACSYSITPVSQNVPTPAGAIQVAVTAAAGCTWTATTTAPWFAITAGASGNGNGSTKVEYQSNSGPSRVGTATIAGQTFTLTQDSGCSYVVAPENLPAVAAGGPAHVDVTAAASCTWTAVSAAPWISVTAGANGSGNGPVDMSVAANTGPARSGTVAVAGRTVTITQDSGCTFALSATSRAIPIGGGPGTVNVAASAGCTWTAASNVPWISISSGSPGSGDGTVAFVVEVNATGAPRSGTLTIAGQVFTVNQG
jgi:Putative binding domain, N-terminal/Viral BACON domain